jgi:hypothetical protein
LGILSSLSYYVAYSFGRTSSGAFGPRAPGLIPRTHRRRKEVGQGRHFPRLRVWVRDTAQFMRAGIEAGIPTDRVDHAYRRNLEVQGDCIYCSPHFSDRPFPASSTPSIANPDEIPIPQNIPRLDAPLTFTHSRTTSAQFAGTRRPRSRSPSPLPHSRRHGDGFPQSTTMESDAPSGRSRPPSPFRPPSPLTFPRPHRLPESIALASSGNIQIPNVVVSGPETTETAEADSSPSFPVPFSEGNVSQLPTAGEEHLMPGPSYPGNLGLGHENARHSSDTLAPPSNQAGPPPYRSDISLQHFPTINESGDWSDGKRRSIGLMHSEQVSRYVNKGDV